MSSYLQCDRDGCGYKETVPSIREEDIGRPCPKCGTNLLTQDDYDYWVKVVQPKLTFLESLGLVTPMTKPIEDVMSVSVHHHGGKTTVKFNDLDV